jgi:hypothetical protein
MRASWPPTLPALLLVASLALGVACTDRPPAEAPRRPTPPGGAGDFPVLPDSLALTLSGGAAVWFSGARLGTDSPGRTCVERGLVIVRGGSRTLVPLLMTGSPPVLVNDSTIRARIWLHCRPGNTYDINLRTAAPTRIR